MDGPPEALLPLRVHRAPQGPLHAEDRPLQVQKGPPVSHLEGNNEGKRSFIADPVPGIPSGEEEGDRGVGQLSGEGDWGRKKNPG